MTDEYKRDLVARAWEEARERVGFRDRMKALRVKAAVSLTARTVLREMDALLGDFGVELLRAFVDELTKEVKGDGEGDYDGI